MVFWVVSRALRSEVIVKDVCVYSDTVGRPEPNFLDILPNRDYTVWWSTRRPASPVDLGDLQTLSVNHILQQKGA